MNSSTESSNDLPPVSVGRVAVAQGDLISFDA